MKDFSQHQLTVKPLFRWLAEAYRLFKLGLKTKQARHFISAGKQVLAIVSRRGGLL